MRSAFAWRLGRTGRCVSLGAGVGRAARALRSGAGLAVSFAFTRFLRGMLFGVGAVDWITFATVAGVLFLVALAACYFPARRAASIEPMQALRTE